MQQVRLEKAHKANIPLIRQLAVLIWHQHYPSIISEAQIAYMLDKMYSEESLSRQIDEVHHFYLVKHGDDVCGFLSVKKEDNETWFLHKFYIDQSLAGKGIGSRCLALLTEITSAKTIRLTVNRQNYKSINFYFRNGFKIESVADFDIGNGYVMNDFVMVWRAFLRRH